MQAKDIMTTDLKSVSPDTTVEDVAKLLLESRISAVPVVQKDGSVVGIISEGDLMRRVENDTMYSGSWLLDLATTAKERVVDFKKLHGRTASEVMTKDVIEIPEDLAVDKIAKVLSWYLVKRVPVVDADGKLTGIVSRTDLIRNLANHDPKASPNSVKKEELAALRRAVQDVISSSRVKPWLVNAFVDGDHVELFGLVDSLSDSDVLKSEILDLPGVSSVDTDRLRKSSGDNLAQFA